MTKDQTREKEIYLDKRQFADDLICSISFVIVADLFPLYLCGRAMEFMPNGFWRQLANGYPYQFQSC